MARKFGFPTIAALEVGQSTTVPPGAGVRQKVALYAKRNNKRFRVQLIGVEDGFPRLEFVRMEITEKYPAGVA